MSPEDTVIVPRVLWERITEVLRSVRAIPSDSKVVADDAIYLKPQVASGGHKWHCAQESDGSAGPCDCRDKKDNTSMASEVGSIRGDGAPRCNYINPATGDCQLPPGHGGDHQIRWATHPYIKSASLGIGPPSPKKEEAREQTSEHCEHQDAGYCSDCWEKYIPMLSSGTCGARLPAQAPEPSKADAGPIHAAVAKADTELRAALVWAGKFYGGDASDLLWSVSGAVKAIEERSALLRETASLRADLAKALSRCERLEKDRLFLVNFNGTLEEELAKVRGRAEKAEVRVAELEQAVQDALDHSTQGGLAHKYLRRALSNNKSTGPSFATRHNLNPFVCGTDEDPLK